MKEVFGDIWDYHEKGNWIVITTNGTVKSNRECVMGRGIALQAKLKYPQLPLLLGKKIKEYGNFPHIFWGLGLISFPVKHHWMDKADPVLISTSCMTLFTGVTHLLQLHYSSTPDDSWDGSIYMVRPGCGNGGLLWKDVKPILEEYLDDRFIVVEKGTGK